MEPEQPNTDKAPRLRSAVWAGRLGIASVLLLAA